MESLDEELSLAAPFRLFFVDLDAHADWLYTVGIGSGERVTGYSAKNGNAFLRP